MSHSHFKILKWTTISCSESVRVESFDIRENGCLWDHMTCVDAAGHAALNGSVDIVQLLLAVPGIQPNEIDITGHRAHQLTNNPIIRQMILNEANVLNNNYVYDLNSFGEYVIFQEEEVLHETMVFQYLLF